MKIYSNTKTGAIAITCCGDINDADYKLLKANDTDAAQEKHVPVAKVSGDTVSVDVGAVAHPMTAEHLISAVILETSNGYQVKRLTPSDAPKAEFKLADGEKAIAAYGYCNLHGLWVSKL